MSGVFSPTIFGAITSVTSPTKTARAFLNESDTVGVMQKHGSIRGAPITENPIARVIRSIFIVSDVAIDESV